MDVDFSIVCLQTCLKHDIRQTYNGLPLYGAIYVLLNQPID